MANYASLTDVQNKLGIQTLDAFTTQRLNFFLNSTTAIINSLLGDLLSGTKTEQIKLCDIKDGEFWLLNKPVTAITKVNGISYTGVKGTDYQIALERKIIIKNLSDYLTNLNFLYFDIEYTAGFTTIPDDIKYLQCILVDGEFNSEGNSKIKSYSLGPRSVTFKVKSEEDFNALTTILGKYLLFPKIV